MHFWELAARRSPASGLVGSTCPKKMGLNWFMPALANRSVGSCSGTTSDDGWNVWSLDLKKSMKVWRTAAPGHDVVVVVVVAMTVNRRVLSDRRGTATDTDNSVVTLRGRRGGGTEGSTPRRQQGDT